MKKLAIISVLLSFLISCNILNFGDGEVTTDLNLESNEITNIQDIEATFTIKNGTVKSITYDFNSGCQASFKILREGEEVFNLIDNVGCTGALTSLTIHKGGSRIISFPKYFDVELEQGNYSFKTYLIGYEDEVNATKEFVVN